MDLHEEWLRALYAKLGLGAPPPPPAPFSWGSTPGAKATGSSRGTIATPTLVQDRPVGVGAMPLPFTGTDRPWEKDEATARYQRDFDTLMFQHGIPAPVRPRQLP
jgi:hypothetical protein